MLRFLVFGLLVAGALGAATKPVAKFFRDFDRSGRVIGGEEANIRDAPYQAAMLFSPIGVYTLSCGGSIIREDVVVCAAHCPAGTLTSMWRVRVGSTQSILGGVTSDVAQIVRHPYYDSATIDNDISLYIMQEPFVFNGDTIAAIPLPEYNEYVPDGSLGLVTGWGATAEGGGTVTTLRKVTVPIVNQRLCQDAYSGVNPVTDHMICAGNLEEGGQDACQGDSGGPLAIDGVLIGITSWGIGCARPGYPGVWGRVPVFVNWIEASMPEIRK